MVWYMSSTSSTVSPAYWSTARFCSWSTCLLRWYARMASMRSSARTTGVVSPAVSRLARYCTGMRSCETSGRSPLMGLRPTLSRCPAFAAEVMGDSGGTYQTMGRVRYSGCRSEEHTSELQSLAYLVCRLLLEKKKMGDNMRLLLDFTRHKAELEYYVNDQHTHTSRLNASLWGRNHVEEPPRCGDAGAHATELA